MGLHCAGGTAPADVLASVLTLPKSNAGQLNVIDPGGREATERRTLSRETGAPWVPTWAAVPSAPGDSGWIPAFRGARSTRVFAGEVEATFVSRSLNDRCNSTEAGLIRPKTEFIWPAQPRSTIIATSASWPTSMPVRRRRPSAFCTIPARRTRSARCMKAPRRWTGWSRSRSAASRSRPPRRRLLDAQRHRVPHQHHRYAGTRRLHRRSGAFAPRARRRRHAARFRRRRRAADGDGVAPGRSLQRSAHHLLEQDGPHRRRLRSLHADDQGSSVEAMRFRSSCPVGSGELFTGHIDVIERKQYIFDEATLGKTFAVVDVPAEYKDAVEAARHDGDRSRRGRAGRRADGEVPERRRADDRRDPSGDSQGDGHGQDDSRCSAAPRSRTRVCRRCSMR